MCLSLGVNGALDIFLVNSFQIAKFMFYHQNITSNVSEFGFNTILIDIIYIDFSLNFLYFNCII